MARTPLFERLGRLLGPPLGAPRRPTYDPVLTRRALLRATMAGLGTAASAPAWGARAEAPKQPRIAIIGAGLAGLTCAHRLDQAGLVATLYEASSRAGGRTYSVRDAASDQVLELGGELIDSGHVCLHNLADELDVRLDDRSALSRDLTVGERFMVAGRPVAETVLQVQLRAVLPRLRALAARADASSATFDAKIYHQLNHMPLAAWLAHNLRAQPALRAVLTSAYRGELGLDPAEQSALNLLFMITRGSAEALALFGESDERYHAHLGSQTFADRLAVRLAARIVHDTALVAAQGDRRAGYQLTLAHAGQLQRAQADIVVFALPFSTLRQVDLSALSLSPEKRRAVAELGYGSNTKVMGRFRTRVWRDAHRALGSITSDEPYQQAWDTSIGQPGASGILTNFLGGEYGLASGRGSAEDWYVTHFLTGVERAFAGVTAAYVPGSATRMHWPSYPHARGSYTCYRPGQWDFYGTEGVTEGEGTLFFAGEHTSLDHAGFMEGAAESGELTSAAILATLGLRCSPRHAWVLRALRSVPQPALGQRVERGSYGLRQRTRARALADLLADGARMLDAPRGRVSTRCFARTKR